MTELKRLPRWEGSLNSCIRCGYCYEHCPIYKSTRWEIDSPRGKLALLFGMLNGEIAPSKYIAEKLFECFHCNRCEEACSSGVPILEVFADAQADLRDAGFEVSGTTSITDQELCVRCLNCVRMCPHEARAFVDGQVEVDVLKCQSCGSCLDVCSAKAISIAKGYGTNPDELSKEIAEFLSPQNGSRAKLVVLACSWDNYSGFQSSQFAHKSEQAELKTFVTACVGRLKAQVILEALERGAWGVLLGCCPEDECDHQGSQRAKARVAALQKALARIGIEPERIKASEIPKGNTKVLTAASTEFLEELKKLGPLQDR